MSMMRARCDSNARPSASETGFPSRHVVTSGEFRVISRSLSDSPSIETTLEASSGHSDRKKIGRSNFEVRGSTGNPLALFTDATARDLADAAAARARLDDLRATSAESSGEQRGGTA